MSKAAFAGLKAVQEIRFHLCQTSKGSEGVRNFLLKSYKNMKAASPRDAYPHPRGKRRGGWHRCSSRYDIFNPAGISASRVAEPCFCDPRVAPR